MIVACVLREKRKIYRSTLIRCACCTLLMVTVLGQVSAVLCVCGVCGVCVLTCDMTILENVIGMGLCFE